MSIAFAFFVCEMNSLISLSGGPGVIDICGKMRPEVGWNKAIWDLSDLRCRKTAGFRLRQTAYGRGFHQLYAYHVLWKGARCNSCRL